LGIVQVPPGLARLVRLPPPGVSFVPLEQVIQAHLPSSS
jgi:hypothetical protein